MSKPPVNKKALDNYLNQSASEEEARKIDQWYDSFDDNRVEIKEDISEEEVEERLKIRIKKSIRSSKIINLQLIGKVAASVVLTVAAAFWGYRYFYNNNTHKAFLEPKKVAFNGRETGALIKLGEESAVILDEKKPKAFSYDDEGFFVINQLAGNNENSGLMELVVPRGKQFKIRLSDGTKVWLNADSRLNFPKKFNGTERIVTLYGQGYFEVEKNPSKPFIVQTEKQRIKVLGTHFEVNSYGDNGFEETSLVEGKVEVSNIDGTDKKILIPGQMAKVDVANGSISEGIFENKHLWINNIFSFEEQPLHEILSNVSRWYNIQVIYQDSVTSKTFSGKIKKDASLYDVIDMLQLVSGANIKIEQNQIIVTN